MELQFHKTELACLQPLKCQVQNQEQTQEVRLDDTMPAIDKVLCAWGQVLLRGKEWRSGGMNVSGGVMVWVLYVPEDGSEPQTVETWIPFQLKWEFPETRHDGFMSADCRLAAVDARSVSARKLMVRATVSVMGEALEPVQTQVYEPGELDPDVRLLRSSYPVKLPREAGEKSFELEEELTLPPSASGVEKIIRYSLQPEIIDQKVMAGKAVFRGSALLHVLYRAVDGELRTWDQEIPFSQFSELDREYGSDAEARVIPAVTGLELEVTEPNMLRLKAGLTGQYLVTDLSVVEVVEDAYSNGRVVTPRITGLEMPFILDDRRETVRLDQNQALDADKMVDVALMTEQPRLRREGDRLNMELSGSFQLLYYGSDGTLQGKTLPWEQTLPVTADENSRLTARLRPSGNPQAGAGAGNVSLRADLLADTLAMGAEGIPMVTGLELGEIRPADPNRPSLILRRAGNRSLWELAKACGSSVEAISQANRLQGEPEDDRMLLIPVS